MSREWETSFELRYTVLSERLGELDQTKVFNSGRKAEKELELLHSFLDSQKREGDLIQVSRKEEKYFNGMVLWEIDGLYEITKKRISR